MNVTDRYLDGTYAESNPEFGEDSADWKVSSTLKAVGQWGIPHGSIAEVGCGGGAIITKLAELLKPASAVGFEPMPEAFKVANEKQTDVLKFRNEPISEKVTDHFDLVICFDVFEHIEDCFAFIRSLKPLSKNILFHIPLDMNAQMVARMKPIVSVRKSVGHIHYFSKETAMELIKDCGFEVSGSFYTFGADADSHGGLLYRMMGIPRRLLFAINKDVAVRLLGGYSLMVHATHDVA